MTSTTSDIIVDRLLDSGVDVVFGLPGDGINGVFEALRTRQEKTRFIQVRHEEAAAFAACAYAKYTGKLGVCIATSGPGGIHLLNGLYDAKCDRVPVLALTGHTYHDVIGSGYQQDIPLDRLFMDVAAYNERISGPAHARPTIDTAIKTALSWRTVAHITIPKDIQEWPLDEKMRSEPDIAHHTSLLPRTAASHPAMEDLRAAAELIGQGKKPAILVGQGALGAHEEVLQPAERIKAPIVKALLGKAVVPDENPYTTGGIGLLGTGPSQDALEGCDTLIIIGSSFPYIEFYPKPGQAKAIQIDIDPSRIGQRHPADVGLVGDTKAILRDLLEQITPVSDGSFLTTIQERMTQWRELMAERGARDDLPMKPQRVVAELNRQLPPRSIISTDSGTNTRWAARHLDITEGMDFSVSGTLASMACGLPYAIAAAVAHPDRPSICVIGDGGLSMLMAEIATLVKYDLPVKVLVIRNNTLGQIKWEQMIINANPEYGVELQPIDFSGIARACGAAGFTIEDPADAAETIRQALACDGPAVIDAIVDPNEPPMPGKITTEQAIHFTEAIVRGQHDRSEIVKTVIGNKIREIT
jgi:pyruvate dehydrogenase (quinone)